jgi:hypothetical protein
VAAQYSDLLDQLHLCAVRRGNPAHMPTVVDPLFEDLRAILLKVREGAGVIVGLDRDVLDADGFASAYRLGASEIHEPADPDLAPSRLSREGRIS